MHISRVAPSAFLILAALAVPLVAQDGAPSSANSTERVRTQPGEMAARAGLSIAWRTDIDAALAEARTSGKPVFWYVPTIAGSYMDRQVEIDRYMLAGPFSWPRTIDLLNTSYVPVRGAANKELCKRFDLETVTFIEPGYLVFAPSGSEVMRSDCLTTHHPRWFLEPLAKHVGVELAPGNGPGLVNDSDLPGTVDRVDSTYTNPQQRAEMLFLFGVRAFEHGSDVAGKAAWTRLVSEYPEHPLAHKVAMELEGKGPFLRGFEIFGELPEGALAARGRGTQCAAPFTLEGVWRAGTDFLGRVQNDAGGFEDSIYDFGGSDGLPNVFVSVTAIASLALDAASAQGFDAEKTAAMARRYALDDSRLNTVDVDEQIWAYIYRLRYLAAAIDADPEAKAWALEPANRAAQALVGMQGEGGSWFHEYPNPFVTASCLIALHDIGRHGVKVDQAIVDSGLDALLKCRTPEGAYTYGMVRRVAKAAIEASVGRGPVCELALLQWGRSTQEKLLAAVLASFEYEDPLLSIRKYDDHTRFNAYGGFFFWYALQGRTEAIAALADKSARTRLAERARDQILTLPEFDGCFVDSHEIGRVYGTSMALWSLDILKHVPQ